MWGYDFTHWTRAGVASVAILDIVSRKWIDTLTSPEETSTQIEVAFLAALQAVGMLELADQHATETLRTAVLSGDRQAQHDASALTRDDVDHDHRAENGCISVLLELADGSSAS